MRPAASEPDDQQDELGRAHYSGETPILGELIDRVTSLMADGIGETGC